MAVSVYWSELLPGAAWQPGIGRRSHNRERVSWVSWDCAPAHGTGLFSGRFAPHLPPFALYLFLVQFDCLVKVHTSSSSFLLGGGGGGGVSLIFFFGEIFTQS